MKSLRKEKTKLLLVNALIKLLKEKTFESIQLKEICETALVHKTSFYNHFEDKYDLLKYLLNKLQKDIFDNVEEAKDLDTLYILVAKAYVKKIKENPDLYKSLLSSNQSDISASMLINIIMKDIEVRLYHFETSIPNNYIVRFYVSGVISVINEWVFNGMKESEEEILNILINI